MLKKVKATTKPERMRIGFSPGNGDRGSFRICLTRKLRNEFEAYSYRAEVEYIGHNKVDGLFEFRLTGSRSGGQIGNRAGAGASTELPCVLQPAKVKVTNMDQFLSDGGDYFTTTDVACHKLVDHDEDDELAYEILINSDDMKPPQSGNHSSRPRKATEVEDETSIQKVTTAIELLAEHLDDVPTMPAYAALFTRLLNAQIAELDCLLAMRSHLKLKDDVHLGAKVELYALRRAE